MITVVNKYKGGIGQYIGRGSPLGNPYSHMKGTKAQVVVATREEAIARYRRWFAEQCYFNKPEIIRELQRLLTLAKEGDLNLVCFCAPQSCHGDVIKEFLENNLKMESKQTQTIHSTFSFDIEA